MIYYQYVPPQLTPTSYFRYGEFAMLNATMFSTNARFDSLFSLVDLFPCDDDSQLKGWRRLTLDDPFGVDANDLGIMPWDMLARQLGVSSERKADLAVYARQTYGSTRHWYGTARDLSQLSGDRPVEFYNSSRRVWEPLPAVPGAGGE